MVGDEQSLFRLAGGGGGRRLPLRARSALRRDAARLSLDLPRVGVSADTRSRDRVCAGPLASRGSVLCDRAGPYTVGGAGARGARRDLSVVVPAAAAARGVRVSSIQGVLRKA